LKIQNEQSEALITTNDIQYNDQTKKTKEQQSEAVITTNDIQYNDQTKKTKEQQSEALIQRMTYNTMIKRKRQRNKYYTES
jgi:hypothetical protein